MTITTALLLSLIFVLTSFPASAGKIYRYVDQNGIATLTKSLPPIAAQYGYDILDEHSLRLIKRIASRDQQVLIKQQQQQQQHDLNEKKHQQQQLSQARQRQYDLDQKLLASYPSVETLLKSRDSDLNYRQAYINDVKKQLSNNRLRRISWQTKAAKQELNGEKINATLQQQLTSIEQEIMDNINVIKQEQQDKKQVTQQFERDRLQLQQLLEQINK